VFFYVILNLTESEGVNMQLNIHAQNLNISEQLKEEFGQRIKGIFERTQQKNPARLGSFLRM